MILRICGSKPMSNIRSWYGEPTHAIESSSQEKAWASILVCDQYGMTNILTKSFLGEKDKFLCFSATPGHFTITWKVSLRRAET